MICKKSLALVLPDMNCDYSFNYICNHKMDFSHIVSLYVSNDLSSKNIMELLNKMYKNNILFSLKKGIDYEWCGLSAIAFSTKETACLFLLFM